MNGQGAYPGQTVRGGVALRSRTEFGHEASFAQAMLRMPGVASACGSSHQSSMKRVELRSYAPARVLGDLNRDVGQLVLIRIERGHRIRRYRAVTAQSAGRAASRPATTAHFTLTAERGTRRAAQRLKFIGDLTENHEGRWQPRIATSSI